MLVGEQKPSISRARQERPKRIQASINPAEPEVRVIAASPSLVKLVMTQWFEAKTKSMIQQDDHLGILHPGRAAAENSSHEV